MNWKVPAILYYIKRNLNSKYNLNSKWYRVEPRVWAVETGLHEEIWEIAC